jgi:beta-glucosidase
VIPADDSAETAAAAELYDGIYNRWFLGGMRKGAYPEDVLDGLGPHMPTGWQDDMSTIAAPVEWLGINSYTCKRIAAAHAPWPALQEVDGPLPKTDMGWEIYPDGLYRFLKRISDEYGGGLPIYVTENGLASPDVLRDGAVHDDLRQSYLSGHLAAVHRAIAESVPVAGYFVWSLLDNYEWAFGYEKRFGLVHVDFDSLKRTPKASYHALAKALARP